MIAKFLRDFESFKPVTSLVGVFYSEGKSKRPIRMGIIVYTAGLFFAKSALRIYFFSDLAGKTHNQIYVEYKILLQFWENILYMRC